MRNLRNDLLCCRTKKMLPILLLGIFLGGCQRSSPSHRISLISSQQNLSDYAKVQVVSSDKNSQVLKFRGSVYDYKFSPDGRTLLIVIYTGDLSEIKELPAPKKVYSILVLWNLETHSIEKRIELKGQQIKQIGFLPGSNELVANVSPGNGDDNYIYIWNTRTWKLQKKVLLIKEKDPEYNGYGPSELLFSPQSHLLAYNFITKILLVNSLSWKTIGWLKPEGLYLFGENNLTFSLNGKLLAGVSCNENTDIPHLWTLSVLDVQTGKLHLYLDDSKFVIDHRNEDACLGGPISFLPDNHTLVAGSYELDTYDLAHGAKKLLNGKSLSEINSTKYHNLGMLITTNKQWVALFCLGNNSRAKVVLWDLKSNKVLYTWKKTYPSNVFENNANTVGALFSPDGKRIILNIDSDIDNNTLQVWNIQ